MTGRLQPLRATPCSRFLSVVALGVVLACGGQPTYMDRAEKARNEGHYSLAYVLYLRALKHGKTEERTEIDVKRREAGELWLKSILDHMKALVDKGKVEEAYAIQRDLVTFIEDAYPLGFDLAQPRTNHQFLAWAWIRKLLPKATALHAQGDIDRAYSLLRALDQERKESGLEAGDVPELTSLLETCGRSWIVAQIGQLESEQSKVPVDLRLAALQSLGVSMKALKFSAVQQKRVELSVQTVARQWVKQIDQMVAIGKLPEAVEWARTLVEERNLGVSGAVELHERLRAQLAARHTETARQLRSDPNAEWFHLQAAESYGANVTERAKQLGATLLESDTFTWQAKFTGKLCSGITKYSERSAQEVRTSGVEAAVNVGNSSRIDVLVDVLSCTMERVPYATGKKILVPVGSAKSVVFVGKREECYYANQAGVLTKQCATIAPEQRIMDQPSVVRAEGGMRNRAKIVAEVRVPSTLGTFRKTVEAANWLFDDKKFYPTLDVSGKLPEATEMAKEAGTALAAQIEGAIRASRLDRAVRQTLDAQSNGTQAQVEGSYVATARLTRKMSSAGNTYFNSTYQFSEDQVARLIAGTHIGNAHSVAVTSGVLDSPSVDKRALDSLWQAPESRLKMPRADN